MVTFAIIVLVLIALLTVMFVSAITDMTIPDKIVVGTCIYLTFGGPIHAALFFTSL